MVKFHMDGRVISNLNFVCRTMERTEKADLWLLKKYVSWCYLRHFRYKKYCAPTFVSSPKTAHHFVKQPHIMCWIFVTRGTRVETNCRTFSEILYFPIWRIRVFSGLSGRTARVVIPRGPTSFLSKPKRLVKQKSIWAHTLKKISWSRANKQPNNISHEKVDANDDYYHPRQVYNQNNNADKWVTK